ncbi:mycofactocin oligosaccharide methyltransferase MftM [Nocardioides kribbensis]|uniref:mycofactocin oligosaccharide methyltransferase MftM n=1 Tax=Nocardioides kribbensis TaxID=305517 RepID=UPI0032D9F8DD
MSTPADHTTRGELERIDPLAPLRDGAYRDTLVEVRRVTGARPRRSLHMVRTPHFDVVQGPERVQVDHVVPPELVDDDLAGLLAAELFSPGWLRGPELFERLLTGVVLTSGGSALDCWTRFYRTTLARIEESLAAGGPGSDTPAGSGSSSGHGTIDGYAPVYAFAEQQVAPGSVLELGCCFGFLSLRLAAAGHDVLASDLCEGTVGLLAAVAPRLGATLGTCAADAARFPAPDATADTVLAVHLLEHLDAEHGERVLAEAVRLARRRVVVAVPVEDVPDETWGHVRTFTTADLEAAGRRSGLPYAVHEHHGAWLVLDTG